MITGGEASLRDPPQLVLLFNLAQKYFPSALIKWLGDFSWLEGPLQLIGLPV